MLDNPPKGTITPQTAKNIANTRGKNGIGEAFTSLKRLTTDQLRHVIYKILNQTEPDLKLLIKDPTEPIYIKVIAKLAIMSFEHGDMNRFNFLLDRSIGKVENVNINKFEEIDESIDKLPNSKITEILRIANSA